MYAYFKGILVEKYDDYLILETNQIGYRIFVSGFTADNLPAVGEEMKIYTYTCVREDAFVLYGFLTKEDLEIFKKLITVSGVGPKAALAVLSALRPDELCFAIHQADVRTISKAPGIGKKTAERIILELKSKISLENTISDLFAGETASVSSGDAQPGVKTEAVQALVALGYGAQEATKAVNNVAMAETMEVEALLKAALKNLF